MDCDIVLCSALDSHFRLLKDTRDSRLLRALRVSAHRASDVWSRVPDPIFPFDSTDRGLRPWAVAQTEVAAAVLQRPPSLLSHATHPTSNYVNTCRERLFLYQLYLFLVLLQWLQ